MNEPDDLYVQLWDEPPPVRLEQRDRSESEAEYAPEEPEAEAEDEPQAERPVRRRRIAEEPAADIETKASEVIQRMTVDTLRRIENRLADLDRREAYGGGDLRASIEAVELLTARLRRTATELTGFLDHTRKISHELAQIQLESRKNLALIAQKLRELEKPQ